MKLRVWVCAAVACRCKCHEGQLPHTLFTHERTVAICRNGAFVPTRLIKTREGRAVRSLRDPYRRNRPAARMAGIDGATVPQVIDA